MNEGRVGNKHCYVSKVSNTSWMDKEGKVHDVNADIRAYNYWNDIYDEVLKSKA